MKKAQTDKDEQTSSYERQNSFESISSLDIIENTMYEMGYTPEGIPLSQQFCPLSRQQREEMCVKWAKGIPLWRQEFLAGKLS